MAGDHLNFGSENDSLPIQSFPKTALQALYHAVTGKTESLSRDLNGNVFITAAEIDNLHAMILDQAGHYEVEFDPTVTIVIKHANDKSVTYSSWARYKALQVSGHEVTSEITLKYEFLIRLANTPAPQRFAISINLDSSLPVIAKRREREEEAESFGFYLFIIQDWRTVRISVDFVDFLVAKIFTSVVEEWFKTLKPTPQPRLNKLLFKKHRTFEHLLGQMGRVGMALFLACYVGFSGGVLSSLARVTSAVALGLALWSVFLIVRESVGRKIFKRISSNMVPTVILLTQGDNNAYSEIEAGMNSARVTVFGMAMTVLLSIGLNVVASYIYTYLTRT